MACLEDKVALITGSSRGIGRGCALEMARVGADVAINYRSHEDEAMAVAEAAEQMGRRTLVVQADVGHRAEIERMMEQVLDAFGRIDILVNNVAMGMRKPFLEIQPEEMARVLDVSLWSVFHCSQLVARDMVKRGQGGTILVISSVHAAIPFGNYVPYNTAKAGIEQMAYTMATELAPHRIRVNVIEPGWIDTPGERKFYTESKIKERAARLPWGRMGTTEEIGKAVAFLASDDAEYITGACLRVDGGFWLPGWA